MNTMQKSAIAAPFAMNYRHFLLWVLVLTGALACQPVAPVPQAGWLARPVVISPFERLDSTGRTLFLRASTEKIYPCINFWLPTTVRPLGQHWSVAFGAVEEDVTGLCLTALGPARSGISLGAPAPGTYRLTLDNLGVVAEGELRVTVGAFELLLPGSNGVSAGITRLGRIPPQTIWGVVGYDTPQQEAVVLAFFEALERLGARPLTLPQSQYGYFETDASGRPIVPEPSGYWFAKTFLYHHAGNEPSLRQLVRDTYRQHNGTVHINLSTDRGLELFGFQL